MDHVPMIRLLRMALWLTALFVLPIVLIRAQSYDDRDLRDLLTSSQNCSSPCFMGIQPGVTTPLMAIRTLQNHEWVASIDNIQSQDFWEALTVPGFTSPPVHWTWNDRSPAWLNQEQKGELWLVDGQVHYVGVYTSFLLGDMLLTLGEPDNSNINSFTNAYGWFWSYNGWYSRQQLWVVTGSVCPIRQLYTRPLIIRFQVAPPNYVTSGGQRSLC